MTEDNARFQRFQKELSIAPLWEEESKRLQKMAASFRAMEREAQALINPAPPAWLAALRVADERLQALIPPSLAAAIPNAFLQPPAISIPDWLREPQRYQAAFERHMCADALEAFDHEPEEAQWFVTQVLRLPRPYLAAVWEVLRQGRWMGADKPLPYVRKAAQRIHARDATQNGSMFNSTLLSLDAPGPTGTLLLSTLHASCDPWPEHETRHDAEQRLEQQGLSAGLSPDALSLYKLRDLYGDHISRRTLPKVLQWSRQRVERAWREMCRKMGPRKKLG
jgi:hypothetical protein